ncbi:hypothetical protein AB747_09270, partial [Escherichia coli]
PVYLRDVAKVQVGPEMRRGIAELNGEGEVAGGGGVLRSGKKAREGVGAGEGKMEKPKSSLPGGGGKVTKNERRQLLDRALSNPRGKVLGGVFLWGGVFWRGVWGKSGVDIV